MKHLPFKLDKAASQTSLLTYIVVTAFGKMRIADYTTGKW